MNIQNTEPKALKCRMWLWLVVPGLHDHDATQLLAQKLRDESV
ncbi:MAG: hypothetical protein V7L05_24335 [Nostoc sp.]